MRKEFYTIADIAIITGLTTRTIRSYLKMGLLEGEKANGIWQFTDSDIEKFLNEKYVKQSIQIKKDILIKDYLDNRKKEENSVCSIYDYVVNSAEEAEKICDNIINKIQSNQYKNIKFSFDYDVKTNIVRIIVLGSIDSVNSLMKDI